MNLPPEETPSPKDGGSPPPPPLSYAPPRLRNPASPVAGDGPSVAVVFFIAGMVIAVPAGFFGFLLAGAFKSIFVLVAFTLGLPAMLLFRREARFVGAGWLTLSALAWLTLVAVCGGALK